MSSFFNKNVGEMNIWEFILSILIVNLIVSLIVLLLQKLFLK